MKSLMKKSVHSFNTSSDIKFTTVENRLISEGISTGLLCNKAFFDITLFGATTKQFMFNILQYPLTENGKEYLDRNFYVRLKDSTAYSVVRDIVALIGFVLGITYTILQF